MAGPGPIVLTYHSISAAPGPTSIPVETFSAQMAELAAAGYRSMTVQDFLDWRAGASVERAALITFDDAFMDFCEAAHPVLKAHGFSALVFAPSARLGGFEAWAGAGEPARPLMSWAHVEILAADGVEFGSHTQTHADLAAAAPDVRRREIEESAADLERRLGRPTRSFAAPYGRVSPAVTDELRGRYDVAFGTRLARPRRTDDLLDVPRIEMHYFRQPRRWRDFLEGRDTYFQTRRLLRAAREAVQGKAPGVPHE